MPGIRSLGALSLLVLLAAPSVANQLLQGQSLVSALEGGGYVILMRHASSPPNPPPAAELDPGNTGHERQLDAAGRASAEAMGTAIHRLSIPIGRVLCSPTYRALQTVRLAQLGQAQIREQLGDAGHSMQADSSGARGQWLRTQVAEDPPPGTNTVIVTHSPNIMEAVPADSAGLHDGEALIFRPDGHGGEQLIARVRIEAWPALAVTP